MDFAYQILQDAIAAVPALKFALGIAGIISVIAIIKSFKIGWRISFFGTIIMLFLMVVLVIFARLTTQQESVFYLPVIIFVWFSLFITMAVSIVFFTSVFFGRPLDLREFIKPKKKDDDKSEEDKKSTENKNSIEVPFGFLGEIKHIIKEVPETTYPPYHDGRRIIPSSNIPIYEFYTQDIQFPDKSHFKEFNISYTWQYHADSKYNPATMRFSIIYPPTSDTKEREVVCSSKSYDSPLKKWQKDSLKIDVIQGVPPKILKIYVPQSGDFEFMLKDMQVKAIFSQIL